MRYPSPTAHRYLQPGGAFVCDVWFGPAVLAIRPGDRVKVISLQDGRLIRIACGKLDLPARCAQSTITCGV